MLLPITFFNDAVVFVQMVCARFLDFVELMPQQNVALFLISSMLACIRGVKLDMGLAVSSSPCEASGGWSVLMYST